MECAAHYFTARKTKKATDKNEVETYKKHILGLRHLYDQPILGICSWVRIVLAPILRRAGHMHCTRKCVKESKEHRFISKCKQPDILSWLLLPSIFHRFTTKFDTDQTSNSNERSTTTITTLFASTIGRRARKLKKTCASRHGINTRCSRFDDDITDVFNNDNNNSSNNRWRVKKKHNAEESSKNKPTKFTIEFLWTWIHKMFFVFGFLTLVNNNHVYIYVSFVSGSPKRIYDICVCEI